MKIGIIYLGSSEGMSDYTFEIARAMNEHSSIVLFLSTRNACKESFENLDCEKHFIETYSGFKSLILSLLFKRKIKHISNKINQSGVDIIFDTMPSPWQPQIKKRLQISAPWCAIIHDPDPHPDRWRFLVKLNRMINPLRSEVLIGISKYCYDLIKAKNPQKTCLLSKHGAYKPIKEASKKPITISRVKNRHKFIFFGRIEAYKGINILIDAFELAKKTNPELELTIIGRGEIEAELKARFLKNGGKLFNEWVSDEFAMQEIDKHGVLVLPYLSATQSGPASIALARGLPCIASNQGALPEQIQDKKNGLIVKSGCTKSLTDAMQTLADSPDLIHSMSEHAFSLADNDFSWYSISENLVHDFSEILRLEAKNKA